MRPKFPTRVLRPPGSLHRQLLLWCVLRERVSTCTSMHAHSHVCRYSFFHTDNTQPPLVPRYLWGVGSRTAADTRIQGCSRHLHKMKQPSVSLRSKSTGTAADCTMYALLTLPFLRRFSTSHASILVFLHQHMDTKLLHSFALVPWYPSYGI